MTHSTTRATSTRMAVTAMPVLIASGLLYLMPMVARPFLTDAEYATWALGAVVASITLVFDFGALPYVLAGEGSRSLDRTRFVRAAGLGVLGALVPGLLLASLWLPYSSGRELALAGGSGSVFIAGVALGGAFRSAALVVTALMLVRAQLRRRTVALLSHAVLQTALLVTLLVCGAGVWAMPIASIVAGVWMCAYCFIPFPRWDHPAADHVSFGTFARARLGLTTLSLSLTQLDRWIVGALVPVGLLAKYDLAARIAGLPRLVLITLSGVLAADAAARRTDPEHLTQVYRSALRVGATVVLALGTAAMVGALVLHGITDVAVEPVMLGALVAAFSLHALTTVGTQMMSGIGQPAVEYILLVPCFVLAVALWLIAWRSGSDDLAVYAAPASFAISSVVFLVWMAGRARARHWHQDSVRARVTREAPTSEVGHGR